MWTAGGQTDLFSNREITLLIEMVQELPVLYAADKKSYKSLISRDKAWKIISDKLNRTVSECEKKWRYLRDKYVKERRRLLDEMRLSGREVKSGWQHYESMEFLATHLRLPCNGADRGNSSSSLLEDDDHTVIQDLSPTSVTMMSPASLTDQHNNMKQEVMRSQKMPSVPWTKNGESDRLAGIEGYPQSATVMPPAYPNFFNRPTAPAFAPHPWLAMWANGLHQANQQLTSQRTLYQTNTGLTNSPNSESLSCNENENSENTGGNSTNSPSKKRKKGDQNIDVTVSLKDVQPAEKYSEYHFCVSLAQMMEQVPPSRRSGLKIKLIQTVSSFLTDSNTTSEHILSS